MSPTEMPTAESYELSRQLGIYYQNLVENPAFCTAANLLFSQCSSAMTIFPSFTSGDFLHWGWRATILPH